MTATADPDPSAPVPTLPVCARCGHVRVCHRRGRCRADLGGRLVCGCTRFTTTPPVDPPAGW